MISKVSAYRASDGRLFEKEADAIEYEVHQLFQSLVESTGAATPPDAGKVAAAVMARHEELLKALSQFSKAHLRNGNG